MRDRLQRAVRRHRLDRRRFLELARRSAEKASASRPATVSSPARLREPLLTAAQRRDLVEHRRARRSARPPLIPCWKGPAWRAL